MYLPSELKNLSGRMLIAMKRDPDNPTVLFRDIDTLSSVVYVRRPQKISKDMENLSNATFKVTEVEHVFNHYKYILFSDTLEIFNKLDKILKHKTDLNQGMKVYNH